jgi:hypothetical protein
MPTQVFALDPELTAPCRRYQRSLSATSPQREFARNAAAQVTAACPLDAISVDTDRTPALRSHRSS